MTIRFIMATGFFFLSFCAYSQKLNWATHFEGVSGSSAPLSHTMADNKGGVYGISGRFYGVNIVSESGAETEVTGDDTDYAGFHLLRIDEDGEFDFITRIDIAQPDDNLVAYYSNFSMAVDDSNHLYLVGSIESSTTIKVGDLEIPIAQDAGVKRHLLILKFNDQGQLVSHKLIKHDKDVLGNGISIAYANKQLYLLYSLVDKVLEENGRSYEVSQTVQVYDESLDLQKEKSFSGRTRSSSSQLNPEFFFSGIDAAGNGQVYLSGHINSGESSDLSEQIVVPETGGVSSLVSLNEDLEFLWFKGITGYITSNPFMAVLSDNSVVFNAYVYLYGGAKSQLIGSGIESQPLEVGVRASHQVAFDSQGQKLWNTWINEFSVKQMGKDAEDNLFLLFGAIDIKGVDIEFTDSQGNKKEIVPARLDGVGSQRYYGFQKLSKSGLNQGSRIFDFGENTGFVDNYNVFPGPDCQSFILSGRYGGSDAATTLDIDLSPDSERMLINTDRFYNRFIASYGNTSPKLQINEAGVQDKFGEIIIPFTFQDDSFGDLSFSFVSDNISLLHIGESMAEFDGIGGSVKVKRVSHFSGRATITISATDACGEVASENITIELEAIEPIAITSTPPTSINQGKTYVYPIETTNLQGGVEITSDNLPEWLQIVNNGGVTGAVTTLAGAGESAFANGSGAAAKFQSPRGITVGPDGAIYVADVSNQRIRRISRIGEVTTFAGNGFFGSGDSSNPLTARFADPVAIEFDSRGNMFVVEESGSRIRKITPGGVVTTFAGSGVGYLDGTGRSARFDSPLDLVIDNEDNLYIADLQNTVIRKVTPEGVVTTWAGTGEIGSADGSRLEATFGPIVGLAIDKQNNIYVSDGKNNDRIRKISAEGIVSTLVTGITTLGLEVTPGGDLLAIDYSKHQLVSIDQAGNVTALAGNGERGFGVREGQGTESAVFSSPSDVAVSKDGLIYVADSGNQLIKQVVGYGRALVGNTASASGDYPISFRAKDAIGATDQQSFTLNVIDDIVPEVLSITRLIPIAQQNFRPKVVFRVAFSEQVKNVDLADFTINPNSEVQAGIESVLLTNNGNTVDVEVALTSGTGLLDLDVSEDQTIADLSDNELVNPVPTMTEETYTIENQPPVFTSSPVLTVNSGALYQYPVVTADAGDQLVALNLGAGPSNLYLSLTKSYNVSTFTGQESGYLDGPVSDALFSSPAGLVFDSYGNLYLGDRNNYKVRKVSIDGEVTTVAGSGFGSDNGQGSAAEFGDPFDMVIDSKGDFFLVDPSLHNIRKIDRNGNVSLFAGAPGFPGFADGTGSEARFSTPTGLAIDVNDNLYVADQLNNRIRKITPEGMVSTLVGNEAGYVDGSLSEARLNAPTSVVVDDAGNVYFGERLNHTIRKIDLEGNVSTLAGNGEPGDVLGENAQFNVPFGLTLDGEGNLFLADVQNQKIKRIDENGVVHLVAGTVAGLAEGLGNEAAFMRPLDLATYGGDLYVADNDNNRIRKISLRKDLLQGTIPGSLSGTIPVDLKATDPFGAEASQTFNIKVFHRDAPEITGQNPESGSLGIGQTDFYLNFSKNIFKGEGQLQLRDYADDAVLESIEVSSDAVKVDGQQATITTQEYPEGKLLYWHIPGSVFNDGFLDFSGLEDKDEWKFSTKGSSTPPIITSIDRSEPFHETHRRSASSFLVTFNEDVQEPSVDDFYTSFAESTIRKVSRFDDHKYQVWVDYETEGELELKIKEDHNIRDYSGQRFNGEVLGAETFNIRNAAPEFTSDPPLTVKDNDAYAYAISINDGDRDGVVVEAVDMPEWLKLENDTLTWVSSFAGRYATQLDENQTYQFRKGVLEHEYPINFTYAVDVDKAGTIYIASGFQILRIKDNVLEVFAGGPGGYVDGTGVEARFGVISAMDIDDEGNLFVIDRSNSRIRKITPEGVVTTHAGSGSVQRLDGSALEAGFQFPAALAVAKDGSIFVTESYAIRKIDPERNVTTVVGDGTPGDDEGEAVSSRIGRAGGITIDAEGDIFVADKTYNRIKKITKEGQLVAYAGEKYYSGFRDGKLEEARFNDLSGLDVDAEGNLYVTEGGSKLIRKISKEGYVITLAGGHQSPAYKDGLGGEAHFSDPNDIAVNQDGTLLVADRSNRIIRKVTPMKRLVGVPTDGPGTYSVSLKVTDQAGAESFQNFEVTVLDIIPPVFTSVSEVSFLENSQDPAYTAMVDDQSEVTFGLGTALDESLFEIESVTGMVSFKTSPDFEMPQDADTDNEYVIGIIATDVDGNASEFIVSITVTDADEIAPEVVISSDEPELTNAEHIEVSFTFSEVVIDFTEEDINLGNAIVTGFSGTGNLYSATVSPVADGTVTINLPSGLVTDLSGNTNIMAEEFSIVSDRTGPVPTIVSSSEGLVNTSFTVTLEFNEAVTNFELEDLAVDNANLSNFTQVTEGLQWTVDLNPVVDGPVSIELGAAAATDVVGNTSQTATFSIVFDATVPVVTAITRKEDNPLLASEATFQIVFSEEVMGVSISDFELALTGTATASINSLSQLDERNYEVTISEVAGEGSIGLNLKDDDSITDPAGNMLGGAGLSNGDFTGEAYVTNFSPTEIVLSTATIAENNAMDQAIGTLSALDPDASDTHTFSLAAGEGDDGNGSFTIEDDQLLADAVFDFETQASYTIRIKAEDGKGGIFEQALTIEVTNVAEPAMALVGTLDFGEVGKNSSAELTFNIDNTGDTPLNVTSLALPEGFSADYSGGNIDTGQSQLVTVSFAPTENKAYSGEVVVVSNAGSSVLTISGEGVLVTSIDDDIIRSADVPLYPNPASNEVTVDLGAYLGRSVSLTILDASGRVKLFREHIQQQKVRLNIADYQQGLFIIKVNDGEEVVYKKFIVKR